METFHKEFSTVTQEKIAAQGGDEAIANPALKIYRTKLTPEELLQEKTLPDQFQLELCGDFSRAIFYLCEAGRNGSYTAMIGPEGQYLENIKKAEARSLVQMAQSSGPEKVTEAIIKKILFSPT